MSNEASTVRQEIQDALEKRAIIAPSIGEKEAVRRTQEILGTDFSRFLNEIARELAHVDLRHRELAIQLIFEKFADEGCHIEINDDLPDDNPASLAYDEDGWRLDRKENLAATDDYPHFTGKREDADALQQYREQLGEYASASFTSITEYIHELAALLALKSKGYTHDQLLDSSFLEEKKSRDLGLGRRADRPRDIFSIPHVIDHIFHERYKQMAARRE